MRNHAHNELEADQIVDVCRQFAAIVTSYNDEGEAGNALLFGEAIDEALENMDCALDWMTMFCIA